MIAHPTMLILSRLVLGFLINLVAVCNAIPSHFDSYEDIQARNSLNNTFMGKQMLCFLISNIDIETATELSTAEDVSDLLPALQWNYRLAEVWIGRAAVNIGSLSGKGFASAIYNILNELCPSNQLNRCNARPETRSIDTSYQFEIPMCRGGDCSRMELHIGSGTLTREMSQDR